MTSGNSNERLSPLAALPSVDEILRRKAISTLLTCNSSSYIAGLVREEIDRLREATKGGRLKDGSKPEFLRQIEERVCERATGDTLSLRRVINATGIIIHTNLGRSILAKEAVDALVEVALSYSNLEYTLEEGRRGSRSVHLEAILCELTGAEAAHVVNNNAAAVLLCLDTFAHGREVIVSRGELIEIGGSFRLPEIMAKSGARLVEVGTTNRTHRRDYEQAITEETALILKAHSSNYRVVGFTASASDEDLISLGRDRGIPVMYDLGSGSLYRPPQQPSGRAEKNQESADPALAPLDSEPLVQETLEAGFDLVTFSGDKLLGGPQAGIIVGRAEYVGPLRSNPLSRAIRADKLSIAALEATLRLFARSPDPVEAIPTLSMAHQPVEKLRSRTRNLRRAVLKAAADQCEAKIVESQAHTGGGSLPDEAIPSVALAIRAKGVSVNELAARLRQQNPPVIARVHRDQLLLDLRTVQESEMKPLTEGILSALGLN